MVHGGDKSLKMGIPVFGVVAWGWLTGCWPSPGWEAASDWVGARKGTKECQGKTGTDRGSTLVHTVERRQTEGWGVHKWLLGEFLLGHPSTVNFAFLKYPARNLRWPRLTSKFFEILAILIYFFVLHNKEKKCGVKHLSVLFHNKAFKHLSSKCLLAWC